MNTLEKKEEALTDEKKQALLRLIQQRKHKTKTAGTDQDAVMKHSDNNSFELSYAQTGIWVDSMLDPESTLYHIPFVFRIQGECSREYLNEAVKRITCRHDALRTVFREVDGEPRQIIVPELSININFTDLSALEADEALLEFNRVAEMEIGIPFDLNHGPLVRFRLYQLGSHDFIFLMTAHHLVFDGWSSGVFCRELEECYNALTEGRESILPKLPVCYGDYAAWQKERMRSPAAARQMEYWIGKLGHDLPVAEFPVDYPRPPVRRDLGEAVFFHMNHNTFEKVKNLAARNACTVNIVLLAALKALLFRYTGLDEIIIGSPVSNRDNGDIENMIGCFINSLVLCTEVEGTLSFLELLARVKTTFLEAYDNKEVPLEKLIEELKPKRDMSRTPFYQVMFNYNRQRKFRLDLNGAEVTEYELGSRAANADITFSLWDDGNGLEGYVEYNRSIYRKDTADALLERYIMLVEQVSENPGIKLNDIVAVTSGDRRLLEAFNNTGREYDRDKTVIELFEEQAERTPDRVAVVYREESLTYGELNRMADSLAGKLQSIGVGPDDRVALLAEKGCEVICGIFGVLKAGGAYVPMDPSYPQERLEYMLQDCAPRAVLVYKAAIRTELPVLDLEDKSLWEETEGCTGRSSGAENLAYIIYTSGTTGKPKGVMIEHRSLYNMLNAYTRICGLTSEDTVLQFASIAFDQSVWDIFNILVTGGTLCIADHSMVGDMEEFREYVGRNHVTIASLTPAFIKMMDPADYPSIRLLESGGAAADADVLHKWSESRRILNTYGPTEVTVNTTTFEYDGKQRASLPIGRPIDNLKIYIVNGTSLCGAGMPGELCIAGDGLARGYLNREDLTAEKFVENPFGTGRMYRSGDLARWLPDGNIEYLGRIDEQVKIRGFRIELGEIESVMRQLPDILDAAVIARDKGGDRSLFGYVVSERRLDVKQIREALKAELPEYMVPAYLMQLKSLPVTRNGKLNKKALPDIEAALTGEYIEPRDQEEELVAGIFCEILGLKKVSVEDSFFDLGGHSLRAGKLINRIEMETGVRLKLKDVFTGPTVEQLAKLARGGEQYEPIPKAGEQEYYPMSSAQKRIYIISELDEGIAYNIPYIMKVKGKLDTDRLKGALEEMLERHEILRTSLYMLDGEPVQRVNSKEEADFRHTEEYNKSAVKIAKEFIRPFDLEAGRVIRMQVTDCREGTLLMLDMHHVVSDGMSSCILMDEISALYNGKELTSPVLQYKDYSEWMRTRDLDAMKAYWIGEFQEEAPVLDLPLDYNRPQDQSLEGAVIRTMTEAGLTDKIKALAKRIQGTEYMVLLSAFMVLLCRYSRQEDIVVGTPISGRTHKDTENMLGMFVNTLAMRGNPGRDKRFIDFLYEMKDKSLRAFENQEYPFEELVEAVQVKRDLSRNPLFDVMFALQNNEDKDLELNGAETEYLDIGNTVSKFDLSFDVIEKNGRYEIIAEYCTALFCASSVERFLEHYIVTLEMITAYPDSKIGEIDIITHRERRILLEQFNNTYVEYDREKTVTWLFEEQAKRTPGQVAVIYGEERLTYGELNRRADSLAAKLQNLGVGPDDRVALLAEKGCDVVSGIMGVLKAGGAYVPMDPSYPQDRLEYMLEDCAPKAVLVYKTSIRTSLPVLDLTEADLWQGPEEHLKPGSGAENLAYIIYTSGTTGKPKGVMIEHHSLYNMLNAYTKIYDLSCKDTVLQFASISFDQSVWDIFNILILGGTLCMADRSMIGDMEAFRDYVNRNHVTKAALTPAFIKMMDPADYPTIKLLESGGAAADADVLHRWAAGHRIMNTYGPTEATVNTASFEYDGNPRTSLPIGRPIDNVQIHIVNGTTLCGIGMPGELCIAGDGLARGYLNQEELTSSKFVENPFGDGRMYRSGDLARWLPDGNIEYMGRIDEQVKIRGFRIELGEIESVIRRLPEVTDAAVAVREKNGDKALYGYIVSSRELDIKKLRNDLKAELPDYMVPAYMMQLESLPVTQNGKLNKKALPDISLASMKECIAPRNERERIVSEIFCGILGLKEVSADDSFFDLGGHSLKAGQLINRIEVETGKRLTLKEVFTGPSVEQLAKLAGGGEEYRPIPKAEERPYYSMSSGQRRVFLVNQLEEHGTAYNIPEVYYVKGNFSVRNMELAFAKMMKRHDIFRTSFHMMEDKLVQKIEDRVQPDFAYIEDHDTDEETLLSALVRPFDLGCAPLARMRIIERSGGWILFIDTHHIITDGISGNIFMEELADLYNGKGLKPLSLQYRDYSEWMKARDITGQKEYWTSRFRGEIPVIELPYDYPRDKKQSFQGGVISYKLPEGYSDSVKELAANTGTTEYMLFLAAFHVLLGKYTGQSDIIIGSPIAGRVHSDTERMLGMFINTVALRNYSDKNESFRQFLNKVRECTLKAYENQEFPFDQLVEDLNMKRDMSHNPLFDVLFVLHNKAGEGNGFREIELEYREIADSSSKLDLTLTIGECDDGYEIMFSYCTALFAPETIKRMAGHFHVLLDSIIRNPDERIGNLDILTEEEKNQLLGEYAAKASVPVPPDNIVSLFERQAAQTPDLPAVHCEGTSYTYRELNSRAGRLAAYLMQQGVGKEGRVALYIERSADMITAMIGVLKSGAAYIPIDPMYPAERVEGILAQADASIIITQEPLKRNITISPDRNILCIDSQWSRISAYPDDKPCPEIDGSDLMYIIFTSGSTGEPKGVMVEHHNYANYLQGIKEELNITAGMSFAVVSTFAADLGTTNVYVPLTTGGQVHIFTYERAADPEKFAEYFRSHRIDAMKFVPSHFEALQVLENAADVIPEKLLIFAGESCTWDVIRKVKELKPECRVYNNYGPTETTVSVLSCRADEWEQEEQHMAAVPLGRPLPGISTYILDDSGKPVPVGVPGELYVGGEGVARGYLNNPILTDEKFIKNPFGRKPESYLYRTGDLVKYLPGGSIYILGRIDRQIKIRGYRVEPEGIESLIRRFDGIANAAVTLKEDRTGDRKLAAYIAVNKGGKADVAALRKYLRDQLPDYMVPSAFVEVEEIPLNANGKTDLHALPNLDNASIDLGNEYAAPENAAEEKLVEIWKEVLDIERVGIDDNFFDLGGDSFKTIKAVKKIGNAVSVIELIKHPTIRSLSEYLEAGRGEEAAEGMLWELTPSVPGERKGNFICVPYGGGNAVTYKALADVLPEGYSLYSVQAPGHDFEGKYRELLPLEETAQICAGEIKNKVKGPVYLYGQCIGGALAVRIAQILEEEKIEVAGVYQAANFPSPRLPGRFFEWWNKICPADRLTSDKVYKESLMIIGGGNETADKEEEKYLLKGIRHDSREADDYYTYMLNYNKDFKKLKAPVCCIVGERDRTTGFYAERYLEWEQFSDNVSLEVIELAGHFFHKHQAAELRDAMLRQAEKWRSEKKAGHDKKDNFNRSTGQKKMGLWERFRMNPQPGLLLLVIVALGQIMSLLGSSLSGFAMGIWVYRDTAQVTDYAIITVFATVPGLIALPFSGVIADRYDRRKVMICSDLIAVMGTIMVIIMFWTGRIEIWHIYAATALGSVAGAFQQPAFLAAMTQIIPKRYLGQASGLVQLGLSVSTLAAPVLGGALVVIIGLKYVLLVDVATCILSVATLSLVRFPNTLFEKREEGFKKEMAGGIRYILKRKSMLALVIFFAVDNFVESSFGVLVNPILLSFTTTEMLGIIVAAQSAGLLAGSLVMGLWGGTGRRADGMIGFVVLSGVSMLLFGLRPSVILTAAALFIMGMSTALVNTHWQILIQTKVGMELQGRVFSINQMFATILSPLAAVAGPVADNIFEPMMEQGGLLHDSFLGGIVGNGLGRGMALMCLIAGALIILWGIAGMKYKPLRYMEDILPDASAGAVIYRDKEKMQELADRELIHKAGKQNKKWNSAVDQE